MLRLLPLLLAFCILVNSPTHAMETSPTKDGKYYPINNANLSMIKDIVSKQDAIVIKVKNQKFSLKTDRTLNTKLHIRVIYSDSWSQDLLKIIDFLDEKISFSVNLRKAKNLLIDEVLISKIATKNWQMFEIKGDFSIANQAFFGLNESSFSTDIIIKSSRLTLIKNSSGESSQFHYADGLLGEFPDELLLAAQGSNLNILLIKGPSFPKFSTLQTLAITHGFNSLDIPQDRRKEFQNSDVLAHFCALRFDRDELKISRKKLIGKDVPETIANVLRDIWKEDQEDNQPFVRRIFPRNNK